MAHVFFFIFHPLSFELNFFRPEAPFKKEDKRLIEGLNYEGIEFPVPQKHYNEVEKQNNIRINVFGYEKGQPFPIHISEEKFEDQMNLLLITKDEKKHYVLIKDFNAFMYNQSKHKEKKHFCMFCLQCFSSESVLVKPGFHLDFFCLLLLFVAFRTNKMPQRAMRCSNGNIHKKPKRATKSHNEQ